MKPRGTIHLRRTATGCVIGQIIDDNGAVQNESNFGEFTDAEYAGLIELIKKEMPDLPIISTELTVN